MAKIELSVAIIFKNEIRCLERCLKSLQPLRERFSTEIVMADTGATDGSRAVAEQYADVLFDFPWINDFSAARNATLEHCSGAWALVVDCDEWLDPNLDELEAVVRGPAAKDCDGASVIQRNYFTQELDYYNDFPAARLLRLKDKPRYSGAIHESWGVGERMIRLYFSSAIVLHHDGYVMLNDGSDSGRGKTARNLALLREEVRREPENPLRRLQMIESGHREADYLDMLEGALALKNVLPEADWKQYGPIFYSYALAEAQQKALPQWERWREEAFAEFPKSYYVTVDANYLDMLRAIDQKDYKRALRSGGAYLRALAEFRADPARMIRTRITSLKSVPERVRTWSLIQLADAELNLHHAERAVDWLRQASWHDMDATMIDRTLSSILWCYADSAPGWEELIRAFWEGIGVEKPNAARAEARRGMFLAEAARIFRSDYIYNASTGISLSRDEKPARDLFLPLAGVCVLGDAAALLRCESAAEADAILARVEKLQELPASAFIHALKTGAEFPLPGRDLTSDEADAFALMLAEDKAFLRTAAVSAAFAAKTPQDILWARSLTLAALRSFDGAAEEERWPLACAFARVQSLFLPLCYGGGALLQEEYLPVFYRFGLHFARALAIMEPSLLNPGFVPKERTAHDAVAELRLALRAAPEFKSVVSCALDRL